MTFPAHSPAFTPAPPAEAFTHFEAVFNTVVHRLDAAIALAAGVTGVDTQFLSRRNLLRLWRAGHSHVHSGAQDGAEKRLTPATELLAILSRNADGAAVIYLARSVLDMDDLSRAVDAAAAVARLAAHLSARADIRGDRAGRLQIAAQLHVDDVILVEQFPKWRVFA